MGKETLTNETGNRATRFLNQRVVPALTALSENTYLSAIRAGMVSVVPLTIIGGLFIIVSYLPVSGWDKLVAPHLQLLQIPVTATFGLLSIFVCFAIGYELGKLIETQSGGRLVFHLDSLYPLLYRLEERGWIVSFWGTSDSRRRVRFYRLTPKGKRQLAAESSRWEALARAVARVMLPETK